MSLPSSRPATRPAAEPDFRGWSYDIAFSRNLGLISASEQQRLKNATVAIAGMGGVGGVHLMTLARLGIGGFKIADPDTFELANFNRQYGGMLRNLGLCKTDVMAGEVRQVNPDVRLSALPAPLTAENIGEFLDGVDILIDGVDFFALAARRLLFREARQRNLWAITAGPLGFSTGWLVFDPRGMSFDEYFDLRDDMDPLDQVAALAVGLCPAATHLKYFDLSQVDLRSGRGPSAGLACQLCSGVTAAETLKILLGRGDIRPAPWYFQFDAYRHLLKKGRIWWGNRHPWQRIKRSILARRLRNEAAT